MAPGQLQLLGDQFPQRNVLLRAGGQALLLFTPGGVFGERIRGKRLVSRGLAPHDHVIEHLQPDGEGWVGLGYGLGTKNGDSPDTTSPTSNLPVLIDDADCRDVRRELRVHRVH